MRRISRTITSPSVPMEPAFRTSWPASGMSAPRHSVRVGCGRSQRSAVRRPACCSRARTSGPRWLTRRRWRRSTAGSTSRHWSRPPPRWSRLTPRCRPRCDGFDTVVGDVTNWLYGCGGQQTTRSANGLKIVPVSEMPRNPVTRAVTPWAFAAPRHEAGLRNVMKFQPCLFLGDVHRLSCAARTCCDASSGYTSSKRTWRSKPSAQPATDAPPGPSRGDCAVSVNQPCARYRVSGAARAGAKAPAPARTPFRRVLCRRAGQRPRVRPSSASPPRP
jgi:hypothetical protein